MKQASTSSSEYSFAPNGAEVVVVVMATRQVQQSQKIPTFK
jgi:hypothetical protein